MATLAKIVFTSVNNESASITKEEKGKFSDHIESGCQRAGLRVLIDLPNNGLGSNKLDQVVLSLENSLAFIVSNNVTKITNVADRVFGSAVSLTERVEVRTSGSASLRKVKSVKKNERNAHEYRGLGICLPLVLSPNS
jgi:hypothetical protein